MEAFVDDFLREEEARKKRIKEGTEIVHVVAQADPTGLPPLPFAPHAIAVAHWFGIQADIGAEPEGLTAKQLARRKGVPEEHRAIARGLDTLVKRQELKRVVKGQVRYQAMPFAVLLPQLLRRHPRRLPAGEREALDWAVLAYQDAPSIDTWQALAEALAGLLAAIPHWPAEVAAAALADPAPWLRHYAGVEPPRVEPERADPLVSALHEEIERLKAANEALARAAAEAEQRAERAEQAARAAEARAQDLAAWWDDFAREVATPALEAFLAGTGRGDLPDGLEAAEVARVRELVLATKADRTSQLAIARALGAVYQAPTAHQRLTTLSFKDHPYDSLWRARAGKYRVVYGLLRNEVHPILIAARGEVYERVVHALKHRHLG